MSENERIYRVIDANLNRLREGLRVVEDIMRYVFDEANLAYKIKNLRHKAKISSKEYIKFRDAANDVLKPSTKAEQARTNLSDLTVANLKRAQESARVLEECFKLIDLQYSELFKSIRYELYEIEKQI
ncbi:thiamine-phosphate pyrophosphorylase [Campylobacter sp. RM9344]|uniref:Thiamine-phosphate pyrophosphorylase n=1 Tax=Campylobacter californiensis TaxID=1032243 RepID=A0AAW3ZYE9_9BACT|nr:MULTISPECIES: thiamine-phosphate pyrophosphorylase [unclassified Campylobacter]MBE2985165.1 thiamine-phosphate pyrophosphorylase [Campylobacter sp. RM6883]MBE2987010.1 thiamine-phosphate pyrophosphorylase [Campylobacter sp. RM12919]MBE2988655.1 thiamine-phosphate pyrophosphorylase [Campylobacter sp. RM12920]MBE2995242.1 thiamine-phosphate pyrophosphorylase [Campylobacter sp. RM6913]MBE3029884.1 thiamine-phosphate pyrophosphorylase [Campylobacter sp. RM9344]